MSENLLDTIVAELGVIIIALITLVGTMIADHLRAMKKARTPSGPITVPSGHDKAGATPQDDPGPRPPL